MAIHFKNWRSKELLLPAAAFLVVMILVISFSTCKFLSLYGLSMRSSLFSGFFTLSGFLLAAKTFIILNMKKEVYSTKVYLQVIRDRRRTDGERPPAHGQLDVYKPLREMGDLLAANVALTLLAAVAQFTLGMFETKLTVAICLAIAAASITLLVFSLAYMWRNINKMYLYFEKEAQDAIAKLDS